MRQVVLLPEMLLGDKKVSPVAKLLYVAIHVYRPLSMTDLARRTGLSLGTVSCLCTQLASQGWIFKTRTGSTTVPVPTIPLSVQDQMAKELLEGFSVSPLKGEYLMRKWLEHLILSDDCMDNARLSVLQNPLTEEPMELDRYYPSLRVGFEHHGPQHFGPTRAYPKPDDFKATRARDLMKRSLCEENGIALVVVTSDDFTLKGMLSRIPKDLPVRQVGPAGPYVKALEKLSTDYRAALSRSMARETREMRGQSH